MKQIVNLKKASGTSSPFFGENVLTPVILSGVLMPWTKLLGNSRVSDFKLVCSNGVEYFIVADQDSKNILRLYSWEDVDIKGLLNMTDMIIIPQKIFPKGPTGELENVIDLAKGKSRGIVKKLSKRINELVLIPAAVFAVMAAVK